MFILFSHFSNSKFGTLYNLNTLIRPIFCSFSGAIHMIHYNSKYRSFAKAAKKKDGLAVLEIFLEVGASEMVSEGISMECNLTRGSFLILIPSPISSKAVSWFWYPPLLVVNGIRGHFNGM